MNCQEYDCSSIAEIICSIHSRKFCERHYGRHCRSCMNKAIEINSCTEMIIKLNKKVAQIKSQIIKLANQLVKSIEKSIKTKLNSLDLQKKLLLKAIWVDNSENQIKELLESVPDQILRGQDSIKSLDELERIFSLEDFMIKAEEIANKLRDQQTVTSAVEKVDDSKKKIEVARLNVEYMEEKKENKRKIEDDMEEVKKKRKQGETEAEEQRIIEGKLKQINIGEEENRIREGKERKIKDTHLKEEEEKSIFDESEKKIEDAHLREEENRIREEKEKKLTDVQLKEEDRMNKEKIKTINDKIEKKLRDEYFEEAKRVSLDESKRTEAKDPASGVENIRKSSENQIICIEFEEDLTWTCVCRAVNSCVWEICMKCESLKPGLSGWVCSICKTRNDNPYRCKSCFTEKGKEINKIHEYWTCTKCKSAITKISKICLDCGVFNNELDEMQIIQSAQDSKCQDWECLYCETKNNWISYRCTQCSNEKRDKTPDSLTVDPRKTSNTPLVEQKSINDSKPEPCSPKVKPSPILNPSQRSNHSNVPVGGTRHLVKQSMNINPKPKRKHPDNRYINKANKAPRAGFMTSKSVAFKYSPIKKLQVDTDSNKTEIKSAIDAPNLN